MPDPVTLISVILLLGVVILVHEWGHFVAARAFGVRVEVFSIGMGWRVFGRKIGDTDWRLSALPIGGYVRMAGENTLEERAGAPDEFLSKPRWQRAIILAGGVTMNVVLAVVLLVGVFLYWGIPYPAYLDSPVHVAALSREAAAMGTGLRPGDRIAEINGTKNPIWRQALSAVSQAAPGSDIQLVVDRGGEMRSFTVKRPQLADSDLVVGWPRIPPVIDEVGRGTPAARAGLKAGDEIMAINTKPIATWQQFVEVVRSSRGQPLGLTLRRDGHEIEMEVAPAEVRDIQGRTIYQIGITNRIELAYQKLGLGEAVSQSTAACWGMTEQIVTVVVRLFQGRVSIRELGGPVAIARQSGQAARRGAQAFIFLMVMISLNLAVLNFLPIPILDGGHIVVLAIEGLLRRDLSLVMKERFMQVGLAFLLVIFAFVMYNDIFRR